jgi:hypothetical protein
MKNTILATVAAFALALSVAPTFAAGNNNGNNANAAQQAQRSESSNVDSQCANIRANPDAYPMSDVRACRWHY